MKNNMITKLIGQDLRAVLAPVIGGALMLVLAVIIHAQGDNRPLHIPEYAWILFGILMGAGLMARDRRLGADKYFAALPVRPVSTVMIRFLTRLVVASVVTGVLVILKWRFDLFFSAGTRFMEFTFLAPEVAEAYSNIPQLLMQTIRWTILGLAPTAAFSAAFRRESSAVASTVILIIVVLLAALVILWLHPLNHVLMMLPLQTITPPFEILILIASVIALIANAGLREPELKYTWVRIIAPVTIAVIGSMGLMAFTPYQIVDMPLEKMDQMSFLDQIAPNPITDGNTLLYGWRYGRPAGIWRITSETDVIKVTESFRMLSVTPSLSGNYLAAFVVSELSDQPGMQIEILNIQGELMRRERVNTGFPGYGLWSPDEQWFVTSVRTAGGIGAVFIPSSASEPVLTSTFDVIPYNRDTRTIRPAGWFDNETLVFYDLEHISDNRSITRLWQMTPGQTPEMIWEGDEWPYRVSQTYFDYFSSVIPERKSVILPAWPGDDTVSPEYSLRAPVMEVFPFTGKSEFLAEIPMQTIGYNAEKRVMVWSDTEYQGDDTRTWTVAMDIESRHRQVFVDIKLHRPEVSLCGRWIFTWGSPDTGHNAHLIDLETMKTKPVAYVLKQAVWTDTSQLAVIHEDGRQYGLIDPDTGVFTSVLKLEGGRK